MSWGISVLSRHNWVLSGSKTRDSPLKVLVKKRAGSHTWRYVSVMLTLGRGKKGEWELKLVLGCIEHLNPGWVIGPCFKNQASKQKAAGGYSWTSVYETQGFISNIAADQTEERQRVVGAFQTLNIISHSGCQPRDTADFMSWGWRLFLFWLQSQERRNNSGLQKWPEVDVSSGQCK